MSKALISAISAAMLLLLLTGAVVAQNNLMPMNYQIERVKFKSQGVEIVGNLYLPKNGAGRKPAVAILGPVAFVKEQSPVQYATRLAKAGYVTLAFDPRFHGESSGEPRRWESARAKTEDLQAALDFLASRGEVDPQKLFLVGVCQGANWTIEAAVKDKRVKKLAIVAGHYLTPQTAEMYVGGKEAMAARLERAKSAREKYEKTGEVEYIPIVSLTDKNALLLAKPVYEWYSRWEARGAFWNFQGQWENRIARMSELDIWGWRIDETVKNLKTPTLMIHADRAASGAEIPKKLFADIQAKDKKLVWLGDAVQLQFYEEPTTIDSATANIVEWFASKN